jgi:hypothetical protein
MTNDGMTNVERMTNCEARMTKLIHCDLSHLPNDVSSFRHSSFIRHSCLVIRHSSPGVST